MFTLSKRGALASIRGLVVTKSYVSVERTFAAIRSRVGCIRFASRTILRRIPMAEDIVRVLRIIRYTGPRSKVEKQIERSMHGTRDCGNGVLISAATLGTYPDILEKALEA